MRPQEVEVPDDFAIGKAYLKASRHIDWETENDKEDACEAHRGSETPM